MQSESVETSLFDLLTAALKGKLIGTVNGSDSGDSTMPPALAMILENRELLVILTTSVAVLVGCFVVLVWKRSTNKSVKELEQPKIVIPKRRVEEEVDDGKKKVTIFFGTQTGTAEGFAKVNYRC